MTEEGKLKLFETELGYINDQNIRKFVETAIGILPQYFFEVAASSSGKYHSALESGFGGLVYHTKAVAKVANYLVNLEQYSKKIEPIDSDCIIAAALLHDCLKHGLENKTGYSVFEHPIIAAEFVKTDERLDGIIDVEYRVGISDLISSHSGQWTTSKRSKTVLPSPQTLPEELVHLSDYIASRGDIHILFDEAETKPALPDINTYVINFGRHSGAKIIDLWHTHKDYLLWCKENIKKEPLQSLIKQLEKQEEDEI